MLRATLLALPALALAACGGAGAPAPTSLSTYAPPPAPPRPAEATPPSEPVNYDTPEVARSNAVQAANALPAWQAGATGEGVVIGIVDSGISNLSGEFDGRIAAQSRDVTGQARSIDDESGHGTAVSAIAAAARNDRGVSGVAPDATIAMMRADNGNCDDGCRFTDSAIAAGVTAAVAAGARVINISLGGSPANSTLRNAFAAAAAADRIIVVSAGNDSSAEVDPLALAALSAAGQQHVIVAGAADLAGGLADFSNRAGSASSNYLMALGERVRAFNHENTSLLYSGTSMAAPAISAAVALLAQAFPNLSGADIVTLLLSSADTVKGGAATTYGQGMLNIGKAMAPSGTLTLAGSTAAVPQGVSGTLGSAFGDGRAIGDSLSALPVTDSFGRSYTFNAARSLRPAASGRLAGRLHSAALVTSDLRAKSGGLSFAFRLRSSEQPFAAQGDFRGDFRHDNPADAPLGFAQRGLDAHAGERNSFRESRIEVASQSGLGLVAASGRLAGESLPGAGSSGFVAEDGLLPADGSGTRGQQLLMLRQVKGPLTLAAAASHRRLRLGEAAGLARTATETRLTVAAELAAGAFSLALNAAEGSERGALLATRLAPGFGLLGGNERSLGAALSWVRPGLRLRAAASRGWVTPQLADGALLRGNGALATESWSLSAEAPAGPGLLSLRLSAPLAVRAGSFRLANGTPFSVAAVGRETIAEAGYALGPLSFALFHRRNAGNQAGLADSGAAFTFRHGF